MMDARSHRSGLRSSPAWALATLAAISTCGFIDRIIMQVLVEPIRREFGLSDLQIGLVSGLAFALLNVVLGLWVARFAERRRRITFVWIGTLLWSVATACCGLVGSFPQLVLARIGVGVGEAVGLPATTSVVSDLYPRERRTSAMSILLLAPPLGAFLGSALGGAVAQAFGWRAAFWVAAAPGFVLATLLALTVTEPPRGRYDEAASADDVPPLRAVLSRLWHRRSLRHMVTGSAIASIAGFGVNAFMATLLVRRFGLSIGQAGLAMGLIASIPASVSVVGAGRLSDKLASRSPAWYGILPAIALAAAGPLVMLAVLQHRAGAAIALLTAASFVQYCYLGPSYGVVQNLVHPRMRASASAVTSLITSLVSASLGPLVIGATSDHLSRLPAYRGAGEALAVAIACGAVFYLWGAAHFLLASRHLPADWRQPTG